MTFVFIAFALMGSAPEASTAAGTATSAVEAATASKPVTKKQRKICKNIASSASRLGGQRLCMTAEDWKREGN